MDADFHNRRAVSMEDQAARLSTILRDVLDQDWASEGYGDSEIAGRQAARVGVAEKVAELYKEAGDSRRKAYEAVAPKPEPVQ